ncbi:outer membrane beta-barrel protein [Catenovulum sp. 2E275]|uniref:outer membrane beta-barrel protein n=1 Tax=Catenovulum sp. 2E275 TaxID=2980497 RepID=UPI0021CF068D|nr:outer membrane beta-barrel protein [Catenovulum sp. 2E275]MCU4676593.1 outer membrane beta-barrel protein [Catenovulum sp. 2E275]
MFPIMANANILIGFSGYYGHNNNLLRDNNSISTHVQSLNIKLGFEQNWRLYQFNCATSLTDTQYQSSEQDNTQLKQFQCLNEYNPTENQNISLNLSSQNYDETRGTGISRNNPNILNQPDNLTDNHAKLTYQYQTSQSQGIKLGIALGHQDKQYRSKRLIALQNNRTQNEFDLSFGYLFQQNTYGFIRYSIADNQFSDAPSRDNQDQIIALGLSWQASAMTSFKAEAGQQNKSYQQSADTQSEYWSLSASWSPKTYSTFTLSSFNRQQSSLLTDSNTQQNQTISLNWQHQWSSQLSSRVLLSTQKIEQLAVNNRQEQKDSAGIGLNYKINSILSSELNWQYEKNQDNLNQLDYQQQIIGLSLKVEWAS